MLVARRFVIKGRVQGVGFRFFAEEAARREGISGWIENRPDGAVEAFAEGDETAVARFGQALRHGPRLARVDAVDVLDDVPAGRATTFRVRG